MNLTHEEIIQLAIELGSITETAKKLGVSKQRIGQIVPKGLIDRKVGAKCIDCGNFFGTLKGNPSERCERCRAFFKDHEMPKTPENQKLVRANRPSRKGIPLKTHCVNGHPRIPENLYGGGNCKLCLQAPEVKAKILAYHHNRWKNDPEFRARKNEYTKAYRLRNPERLREYWRNRWKNDPEYRERHKERARARRQAKKAKQAKEAA